MTQNDITYDDAFYADLVNTAEPSAAVIGPMVLELTGARSIVDVGCGDGSWLAAFKAAGVERILGLDGNWLDEACLRFPSDCFRRADLFAPLRLTERFDLAVSLEVAEHLPEARAAGFVADLVSLAPVVLFSAAIPLQEGPNHLNEQWPSYWARFFEFHGYVPVDAVRMAVWTRPEITWWYKQNTLIYVEKSQLAKYPALAEIYERTGGEVRDLVHPEKYRALVKRAHPDFGRWLKMLPGTFTRRRRP